MRSLTLRHAGALLIAGALAIAGCSGDKGSDGKSCSVQDNGDNTATISCSDGTSVTVNDGTNGVDGNPASCTITPNADGTKTITCSDGTSIVVRDAVIDYLAMTEADKADMDPNIVVTNVTMGADGKPVVGFRVNDRHGNGIKNIGTAPYPAFSNAFAILKLAPPGVNVSANETWVSYIASTTSTASTETTTGSSRGGPTAGATLIDHGDGSYSYKFARNVTGNLPGAIPYDPSLVHRVVIILSTTNNAFRPINAVFDFVPATGEVRNPDDVETVDRNACLECHSQFRAKAGSTAGFHSGVRYDVRGCVACHNDQRRMTTISGSSQNDSYVDPTGVWTGNLAVVNGEAYINLPVFIHKIHMGEHLQLHGGNYPGFQATHVTYPQDVRNCAKCHRSGTGGVVRAGQASNWKDQPSRRACGACHDGISFTSPVPNARAQHTGGARTTDLTVVSPAYTGCNGCHAAEAIADYHRPIALPSLENAYVVSTMSANTNAGWMPAAGQLPAEATQIVYDISSVTTVAASGGGWNGQMKFKFKKKAPGDAALMDVVFNSTTASAELMDGFVNSPSIYFVFAVPQDGIAAPSDWNASISATIKNLWKGTGGSLSLTPDSKGYYTATITGTSAKIPANARMLTGGIGYSYSLSSSPPLTQTGLTAFPYNSGSTDITCAAGVCPGGPITLAPKMGGLVVTAPNVWKVATGHTARRTIVDTGKCNDCHAQIGSNPSFHAGQRNDGPTCAFCHNTNRTNSGWAVNAKDMVHAIHASAKRDVDFNYYRYEDHGFMDITYPGVLRNCEQCHVAGMYDFSASSSAAAVENLLWSTNATSSSSAPWDIRISPLLQEAFAPQVVTSALFVADDVPLGYGFATSNLTVKGRTLDGGATQKLTTTQTSGTVKLADNSTKVCTVGDPCVCTPAASCTKTCAVGNECVCTKAETCSKTCTLDAPCQAEGVTLVTSPITATCVSCHTTETARGHFVQFGGALYEPRATAFAKTETCLMCHGPGKVAAIRDVHLQP